MTQTPSVLNVLFLCTHNAARSILAEAQLNALGTGRFKAYSAGTMPRPDGLPNPLALAVLEQAGIDTTALRSKRWDVFAGPDAPAMDLIITLCDLAAGESCPIWPGHLATAHWGYADPSQVEGDDAARFEAFRRTMYMIRRRIEILINLPADKLEVAALGTSAREIGES